MKKSLLYVFSLLAFSGLPLCALGTAPTTEALFMNIDADAAGMALGGAVTARAQGPSAAAWNPAALSGLGSRFELLADYTSWIASFNHFYLAAAFRVNSNLVLAVDGRYLAPGGLDDPSLFLSGQDSTPFSDFAAGATAVGTLGVFSLGLSARYLMQTVGSTSSPAVSFAAGLLARLGTPVNRLNLGVAALNLGTAMAGGPVGASNAAQNATVRFGAAYLRKFSSAALSSMSVSADGEYAVTSGFGGRFGLELTTPFYAQRFAVALRLGAQVSADVTAPSAGLGLDFGRFVLDWGISPRAGLGVVQSVGTTFRF